MGVAIVERLLIAAAVQISPPECCNVSMWPLCRQVHDGVVQSLGECAVGHRHEAVSQFRHHVLLPEGVPKRTSVWRWPLGGGPCGTHARAPTYPIMCVWE